MKNRVQSICSFRKSVQYWEENFLNFFRFILPNSRVISNKMPWSIQSSKQQSFTVLINIFPPSNVSYCPFVWMWHGRILHNRIFRLHLQEETFIISMFARWREIYFFSQWHYYYYYYYYYFFIFSWQFTKSYIYTVKIAQYWLI